MDMDLNADLEYITKDSTGEAAPSSSSYEDSDCETIGDDDAFRDSSAMDVDIDETLFVYKGDSKAKPSYIQQTPLENYTEFAFFTIASVKYALRYYIDSAHNIRAYIEELRDNVLKKENLRFCDKSMNAFSGLFAMWLPSVEQRTSFSQHLLLVLSFDVIKLEVKYELMKTWDCMENFLNVVADATSDFQIAIRVRSHPSWRNVLDKIIQSYDALNKQIISTRESMLELPTFSNDEGLGLEMECSMKQADCVREAP